jgi:hypothetical protein
MLSTIVPKFGRANANDPEIPLGVSWEGFRARLGNDGSYFKKIAWPLSLLSEASR